MTIKLNSEKEIFTFLTKLLEKTSLKENDDPYAEEFKYKYENDKSDYNLKDTKNDDKTKSTDEIEEEEEIEVEKSKKIVGNEVHASLDSLIRAVNVLRSGESLKRSGIRDEVATYYDRLEEPERNLLVLFMRELGDILTGEHSGDAAQEPSEEPTNINVSIDKSVKKPKKSIMKKKKIIRKQAKEIEDTSPPIKVSAEQDLSEIFKRFKKLSGQS
jgi:hypothetical protein